MGDDIFQKLKDSLADIDPVSFCERYLILDGKPFRISKGGYKPFTEIYRYIGIKALEATSRPTCILKGRQTGASTMANNLCLYMMASSQFGVGGRSPMRILHAFPSLVHTFNYAKKKFNPSMVNCISVGEKKQGKKILSYVESKLDKTSQSNDLLQYKQFINGNWLSIDSVGINAD